MTREEISERAGLLTMAVTLKLTGSGADMIEAATDQMVDFYRATLEEAARAVCVGCDSTDKLFNDGVAWMHRDESPGYEGPYYRCVASKIHDLIAALDKEAKGE